MASRLEWLGPNVNSASPGTRPSLSRNGKRLYFGSGKPAAKDRVTSTFPAVLARTMTMMTVTGMGIMGVAETVNIERQKT